MLHVTKIFQNFQVNVFSKNIPNNFDLMRDNALFKFSEENSAICLGYKTWYLSKRCSMVNGTLIFIRNIWLLFWKFRFWQSASTELKRCSPFTSQPVWPDILKWETTSIYVTYNNIHVYIAATVQTSAETN